MVLPPPSPNLLLQPLPRTGALLTPPNSTSSLYLAQTVQPGASRHRDPVQESPGKSRRGIRGTTKIENVLNRTSFYFEEEIGDLVHSSGKKKINPRVWFGIQQISTVCSGLGFEVLVKSVGTKNLGTPHSSSPQRLQLNGFEEQGKGKDCQAGVHPGLD